MSIETAADAERAIRLLIRDRDDAAANESRMITERNKAEARAARVERERDEARAELAKVARLNVSLTDDRNLTVEAAKRLIDPTRWRGPHGEPREDDDHRWREAVVAGKRVLLRCYFDTERTAPVDKFWAEGPDAYFRTIDAACEAADKHVAWLATKERTFTVEREPHADWWRITDGTEDSVENVALASAVCGAAKILCACGMGEEVANHREAFLLDHAQLFRDGGTIRESAVRAWLAGRKP